MAITQEEVLDALKECYDPEIPVNIVDMGLIYEVRVKPADIPDMGREDIEVEMTLTAPGCGMGPSIASDAQRKILRAKCNYLPPQSRS